MELIVILVVVAVVGFLAYQNFKPKAKTIEVVEAKPVEVKAVKESVSTTPKTKKPAVKKPTTRKTKAK